MNGVTKEFKFRAQGIGTEFILNGSVWKVLTCLYVDVAVLFAEDGT